MIFKYSTNLQTPKKKEEKEPNNNNRIVTNTCYMYMMGRKAFDLYLNVCAFRDFMCFREYVCGVFIFVNRNVSFVNSTKLIFEYKTNCSIQISLN